MTRRRARTWTFLAALLLAASAATASRAGDLPEIRKRGTLRVLVWTQTPPELFALHPGPDPGFEGEMLEGFAKLHKLRLEVVPVDSLAGRLPALLEKKGDLVAGGLAATTSRREIAVFTDEVFPLAYVVVTLKPHRVETLAALRRERVGTVRKSSWAEQVAAAGVPPANVDDSFGTSQEMVAGLHAKTISAMVLSVRFAILEQRRDPELDLGLFVGETSSGCYAVRKDQPQLLTALNEYIGNVRRSATWNRLVVKYFGASALDVLKRSRER